jgi:UDP-N-acetylmuramyl tripeptide synthase
VPAIPPASPPEPPEYPSPTIVDSRRLLGASVFGVQPGAVLEVTCDDSRADELLPAWSRRIGEMCMLLGWCQPSGAPPIVIRRVGGGAQLFLAAPIDVLMTATEANEQAWLAAETLAGDDPIADGITTRLTVDAERERATRPNLATVRASAMARALSTTFDDDAFTVGSGAGGRTWPLGEIPTPMAVPWDDVHDARVVLVTGSNGKTTTTRLVAAMQRAADRSTGWSCSDGVWVNDAQLESGDYSGPAGARAVLRDARVEAAVLETARGGILRRGLAVTRADAAIVTNISADHFGEYGVASERDLAEVKAVVALVLGEGGCLVLNADDALLVEWGSRLTVRRAWFSAAREHPALDAHVLAGGSAAIVRDDRMMMGRDGTWHDLGAVDDMPLTLRGAAPHNVQNILGAALLALETGVSLDVIRHTLATFGASPGDNPGRLQVTDVGGVTVLVDYAHNPDGLAALCETAKTLPARRRLLLLGQAGNRDDEQLRALVRAAWSVTHFDRVIVKEIPDLLRGRPFGQLSRILADELSALGVPEERVEIAGTELDAVRRALTWAADGDLLVCPIHSEKSAVLALLQELRETDWRAGTALPD